MVQTGGTPDTVIELRRNKECKCKCRRAACLIKAVLAPQLVENHHPWLKSAKFIGFMSPASPEELSTSLKTNEFQNSASTPLWHGTCLFIVGRGIPIGKH